MGKITISLNLEDEKKLAKLKKDKKTQLKKTKIAAKKRKSVNLNKLKLKNDYILQLNEKIKDQKKLVAESNKKVEKKHDYLVNAVKDKKIVQKWRGSDWPQGHYSTATFELEAVAEGTKLIFTQTSVPEQEFEMVSSGWYQYYWKPMKKLLEK